jgi:mono/diheme cytochrome c family protein
MRFCLARFVVFAFVAASAVIASNVAWSQQARIAAGREMAQTYCAGCHAIGKTGQSSHTGAPPFRTLSQRYPIDSLAEAFAEGIQVGHRDMPEWRFEPPQIDNLLAYLKSVQVAPAKPRAKRDDASAETAKSAAAGATLAQANCASCHAVGGSPALSPNPNAPPFRAIANLPGFTSTAFSAWLLSSHASMPMIKVEPADRTRLYDYLQTLNRKANSL